MASSLSPPKTLVFLKLSMLLLITFFFFFFSVNAVAEELKLSPSESPKLSPSESPKLHHHHHHHHNHHHPVYPPSKPPVVVVVVHPPVKPPIVVVHPPLIAPVVHHPPVVVHHPPVKPPVVVHHPPAKAPGGHPHPPVKPPAPARSPFQRNYIAVQGVVFCKSCKYPGIDTLWHATALPGSKVKLECNNTKYRPVTETAITDKNGYFIINPKGVTTAAFHKCKVFLLSSPSTACNVPTNIHYGITGATLKPATDKPPVATPDHHLVQLFSVGPFAYEPFKKYPCPKY